jgi:menaquinone-dependent protoporphyrinogen oxidase
MKILVAVASRHGATKETADVPVGERVKRGEAPAAIPELVEAIGARGHGLFEGKIDRNSMRFAERAAVTAWPTIRAWGREIATALHKTQSRT